MTHLHVPIESFLVPGSLSESCDLLWLSFVSGKVCVDVEVRDTRIFVSWTPRFRATLTSPFLEPTGRLIEALARDYSTLELAQMFSVSESTMNRRLSVLLAATRQSKVSIAFLSRVLRTLASDQRGSAEITLFPKRGWPRCESAVVLLALSGWSISQIAQARGRSVVTSRKQLQSAAHREGCTDVMSLAAKVAFNVQLTTLSRASHST